ISTKSSAPRRVAEDDERIHAGRITLFGADHAPESRLKVEQGEIVSRHASGQHSFRSTTFRCKPDKSNGVASDVLEHIPSRGTIILKIGKRNAAQAAGRQALRCEDGQAFTVSDWQWSENEGVDDAKNCSVDANAQRKR